jgi:hypothetical protein
VAPRPKRIHAEHRHFTISESNHEASESLNEWADKGECLASKICEAVIKLRREERQAELLVQNGGLASNDAFFLAMNRNDGLQPKSPLYSLPSMYETLTYKHIKDLTPRDMHRLKEKLYQNIRFVNKEISNLDLPDIEKRQLRQETQIEQDTRRGTAQQMADREEMIRKIKAKEAFEQIQEQEQQEEEDSLLRDDDEENGTIRWKLNTSDF